jgi:hypothetical protein
MGIVFATCNISNAIRFINSNYPDKKDLTQEDIPKLTNLIKDDVLRVQDPMMHNPCQIILGKKYIKKHDDAITEAIEELEKRLKESE